MGAVPYARRRQPHRHEDSAPRARRRARPSSAAIKSGTPGTVSRGPVFSEFNVAHPFGKKGSFATTVRLYNGLRRIDIRTRIVNDETFVRYRVLFPTSIRDGQSVQEIPFGAIRRPDGIEFPGPKLDRLWQRPEGRGAVEPRPARQQRGRRHDDAFAVAKHADRQLRRRQRRLRRGHRLQLRVGQGACVRLRPGSPCGRLACRRASIATGMEFNHPLMACPMASHPGKLPKRWGFLEITPQNIVVSALKPGPDGTAVLRIYEAAGQATVAKIRLSAQVVAAEEVNLMEDPGRKLPVTDNTLQLDFRPFEIKTIKLFLERGVSPDIPTAGGDARVSSGRPRCTLPVLCRRYRDEHDFQTTDVDGPGWRRAGSAAGDDAFHDAAVLEQLHGRNLGGRVLRRLRLGSDHLYDAASP